MKAAFRYGSSHSRFLMILKVMALNSSITIPVDEMSPDVVEQRGTKRLSHLHIRLIYKEEFYLYVSTHWNHYSFTIYIYCIVIIYNYHILYINRSMYIQHLFVKVFLFARKVATRKTRTWKPSRILDWDSSRPPHGEVKIDVTQRPLEDKEIKINATWNWHIIYTLFITISIIIYHYISIILYHCLTLCFTYMYSQIMLIKKQRKNDGAQNFEQRLGARVQFEIILVISLLHHNVMRYAGCLLQGRRSTYARKDSICLKESEDIKQRSWTFIIKIFLHWTDCVSFFWADFILIQVFSLQKPIIQTCLGLVFALATDTFDHMIPCKAVNAFQKKAKSEL